MGRLSTKNVPTPFKKKKIFAMFGLFHHIIIIYKEGQLFCNMCNIDIVDSLRITDSFLKSIVI